MKTILKLGFGSFLTAGLLGCPDVGGNGKLLFADNEAALFDGPNAQNFALGDQLDLRVTVFGNAGVVLGDDFSSAAKDETLLSVEATTFSDNATPDLDDDALRIQATALAEGAVELNVSDAVGVVDFVTFNIVAADSVLVHPIQFDANSNKFLNNATLNLFLTGNVPLATRLDSAEVGELRGQIPGTVSSDSLSVAPNFEPVAFELGEKFTGAANATPVTSVSLFGAELGAATVGFSDAAGTFLENITVNVVPLDPAIVTLVVETQGQDPVNPVSIGDIKASSLLTGTNEEIFGGRYEFVELVPPGGAALLSLFPSEITDDKVTFTVNAAGTAQVEVSLVDEVGLVVTQEIVTINVIN